MKCNEKIFNFRISQENNNVQAGEGLIDNLTLKEIAIELMFAGYFTTASALTSCILELARNPRVVQKLEEELIEYNLLNDEGNDFSNIDLSLIHRLTYMDHVQKETLRIKPSLLGGYRRAKTTFQLGVSLIFIDFNSALRYKAKDFDDHICLVIYSS